VKIETHGQCCCVLVSTIIFKPAVTVRKSNYSLSQRAHAFLSLGKNNKKTTTTGIAAAVRLMSTICNWGGVVAQW